MESPAEDCIVHLSAGCVWRRNIGVPARMSMAVRKRWHRQAGSHRHHPAASSIASSSQGSRPAPNVNQQTYNSAAS
eukprot:5484042-Alexandrium_andersonii.AAC.1